MSQLFRSMPFDFWNAFGYGAIIPIRHAFFLFCDEDVQRTFKEIRRDLVLFFNTHDFYAENYGEWRALNFAKYI